MRRFASLTGRNAMIVIALAAFLTGCVCGIAVSPLGRQQTAALPTALQSGGVQASITQIAVTAVTQIAGPTYTPYPTYTPQVKSKPIEILVTATYPPDFTALYEFTGRGKSTTDLFSLPTGIIRVKWEYMGDSNFAFSIKRLDNDSDSMLENTIGSTTGQSIFEVGNSDQYLFDVVFARGDWKITVEFKP